MQLEGRAPEAAQQLIDQYISRDYHQVTDVINDTWDARGMVQQAELLLRIGYTVAQGKHHPQWNADAEFSR